AEILAYTGCRIDEARCLKWKDVDFKSGMLRIHGTKTEASNRTIPMANQLVKLLRSKFKSVQSVAKKDTLETNVFPVTDLNKRLKPACDALSIEYFTNHDIRDYFATTCLEAGIPVHTVATWLGHRDGGALLLRRYAHLRDQHSAEQARKLVF
ncbi:MAG: site-specific integrase, partial [Opitutales bacterium]